MDELWHTIQTRISHKPTSVAAISSCGRLRLFNGEVVDSYYRQSLRWNGRSRVRVHRIIADLFIPKTDEDIALGRDRIDHITHHPSGMNINDVRNLRWCTQKENNNFPEAMANKRVYWSSVIEKNKARRLAGDTSRGG